MVDSIGLGLTNLGPKLRSPRRWQKYEQSAENDNFYGFRSHHPAYSKKWLKQKLKAPHDLN